MTSLEAAANRSLEILLFQMLEVESIPYLYRMTMDDTSCEEASGRMEVLETCQTCQCVTQSCMESTSGLGLVPLRLDDMDSIFADNNVVATKNTTIAELIESISEGATARSAADTDYDNSGRAPHSVAFATSSMKAVIVKPAFAKQLLGRLGNFFQGQ